MGKNERNVSEEIPLIRIFQKKSKCSRKKRRGRRTSVNQMKCEERKEKKIRMRLMIIQKK